MDKDKLLESLSMAIARYEDTGLLVAEDMQIIFDQVGVARKVSKGDNVVHAIATVQLAVIRQILMEVK